ncbi:hypothetical protein LTR08_005048 [Meristemomyces frigidus]|nr:hypothetical protein LTR08_005048 [Meristemomyces frigidus]
MSEIKQVKPGDIDWNDPPFKLSDVDKDVLATKEEDCKSVSWEELKHIIANNKLETLQRRPAETRRYLAWSYGIKQQYDGMTDYIVKEKLHWKPIPGQSDKGAVYAHKSDVPFAERGDYTVLPNDWPYDFEKGITHVLVWTKTPIETDSDKGDVTPNSRRLIEEFVSAHFGRALGEGGDERVQWFKNWVSLQSVRSIDHVHVLVRDPPAELLDRWLEN